MSNVLAYCVNVFAIFIHYDAIRFFCAARRVNTYKYLIDSQKVCCVYIKLSLTPFYPVSSSLLLSHASAKTISPFAAIQQHFVMWVKVCVVT